jgi:hypothetical protein
MSDIVRRSPHTFHIPVMGTSFSIDTPLRIARYGMSSVISLVDDLLIEQMRRVHSDREDIPFEAIDKDEEDSRARRITAYLDLVDRLVAAQVRNLQDSPFTEGSEITRYFELLPESPLKVLYRKTRALTAGPEKEKNEALLRAQAVPGSIDVNIMTKVDRTVYRRGEPLPPEFREAMAALRGFARSTLRSSVVFSAGMNMHLYSYAAAFEDFSPDERGQLRKQIVLKVSDYRSAVIQGKFFAKRGLWVSEFRIESGLNCGGHAFATQGHLIGPIMEEFRENRTTLLEAQHETYQKGLARMGKKTTPSPHEMRVTVQGGIGDTWEDRFLMQHYGMDSTGWGTPFLLCPEVATVDDDHLRKLTDLEEGDVYLSESSPLGLPFWNLRTSASEETRRRRDADGRPGSPCPKGHLKMNTEFTDIPICPASRAYQKKKLRHLEEEHLSEKQLPVIRESVTAKSCICHDLAGAATLKHGIDETATPAICCGPNIVNFHRIATLDEMAGHIYGRLSLLAAVDRPHMFIRELMLYVSNLRQEVEKYSLELSVRPSKYFREFKDNLARGIEYYRSLAEELTEEQKEPFRKGLSVCQEEIARISLP